MDQEAAGADGNTTPLTRAGTAYHEIVGHGIRNGDEREAIKAENHWRAKDPDKRGGARKVPQ